MKKVLSLLIVLCMMLCAVPTIQAADYALAINNNVALMVGNNNAIAWNTIVKLNQAPVEENGTMLAPVHLVASAFNGTVTTEGNLVLIDMGGERSIQMAVGNRNVVVNGQVYVSPVAPKLVNSQLMLPVEFLAETVLGKFVYYDAATKMAVITQRKCLSSRDKEALSTISGALTSGSLPAIVITAPVIEVAGDAFGGVTAETGQLTFVNVSADQEPEPENGGACMIDGNLGSRWASNGPASAVLDLGSAKPVTHIKVAVWKPNERSTNYSLEVSSDGRTYTKIHDGGSSGTTYDSYDVNDTIRYVRINPNGTSVGAWASILELEAWNGTAVATTPATGGAAGTASGKANGTKVALTQSMLKASQTPEAENHVGNLLDGNKQTVWASQGDASVVIDLGSAKTVSSVGVAMRMYEDTRTIPYDVEVSTDGVNYTQIWTGESDQATDATKYVNCSVAARYVRITAHGNTVSGWNSIAEVEVYSTGAATGVATTTTTTTTSSATTTTANGTKLTLTQSMLTGSQTPEAENHVGNLVDGNKMTVWASQNEANVVIDLGAAKTLSAVGVAMKMYDDTRTIPYKIEISADGVSYTEVWSGDSDPQTDSTKYSTVTGSARYIRITAFGNTVSGWNSIAEVEVYTK